MGVVDEVLLSLQTTIGVVLPFRRIWGFWSLPNLSANCWPPLATQKHFTNMLTVSVYWNYALPRAAQTFFNRSSIFGWHSAEPEKNWLHLSCSSDLQLSRNLTKPSAKKNKHAVYSLVADLKFCSASATDGKEQFAIYYTVLIVVGKNIIVTIEITFFYINAKQTRSLLLGTHTHIHVWLNDENMCRLLRGHSAQERCERQWAMRETMHKIEAGKRGEKSTNCQCRNSEAALQHCVYWSVRTWDGGSKSNPLPLCNDKMGSRYATSN